MNEKALDVWLKRFSGLKEAEIISSKARILSVLESQEDPNALLAEAIKKEMRFGEFVNLIKNGSQAPKEPERVSPRPDPVPQPAVKRISTPSLAVKKSAKKKREVPAFVGKAWEKAKGLFFEKDEVSDAGEKPEKETKFYQNPVIVGVGVVLLVFLIAGALFLFVASGNKKANEASAPEANSFSVTLDDPSATDVAADNTYTVTSDPVVTGDGMYDPVSTSSVDDGSQSWFMVKNDNKNANDGGLDMAPPSSLVDLFRNPNWSFNIFVIVLLLIIGLARQERFAEQDQTDWRVIKIGYILFFAGLLLSPVIGFVLAKIVLFFVEVPFTFDPIWVQIVFSTGALIAFLMAAITGKIDWTPVSVGLFTMGGFLVAFNPVGPGRTIGYIMMVLGVLVHVVELSGEQGTAGALGLVLVGLPLFIAGRYGFAALLGLISNVDQPTETGAMYEIVRWLCFTFYNYRVLWATVISVVIAYAAATGIAAVIFPPIANMLPQSGQLVGNLVPTEDTPRIDAVVMLLMAICSYWMIVGHF